MNACWSRVPGVAYCFGDEPADDGGDAAGRTGLEGADLTFAGLAAGPPRSCPVARTPGTAPCPGSTAAGFPAAGPAPGIPPDPASAAAPGRPGTAAAAGVADFAFAFPFAGAALALAGAVPPGCGTACTAGPDASPAAGGRLPLSTKPTMPWSASGAAETWALTVRPGRESAAMVPRTPPE